MNVVILAGGISKLGDPLYSLISGKPKALLKIAEKPMIQWILDAIGDSEHVERVVIAGLKQSNDLNCSKDINFIPDHGDMFDNVLAGAKKIKELDPDAQFVLNITSDIPAITGEMIDWVIEKAKESEDDFYYCVIDKKDMEARFPGCGRTFHQFRDRSICGGDLAVIKTSVFFSEKQIWRRLIEVKKSKLKTAAAIGFTFFFLYIIRRITIEVTVKRAGKKLGIRGRALLCPYPEIGMDVDKPFQFELLQKELNERNYNG